MDFRMLGKLALSRETDTFKPYSVTKFESGWQRTVLRFNAVCGDNRHTLQLDAGCWADGHGDIYAFTKATVDANGTRQKGTSIQIPFKERLTSKHLPEIADFRKYVFDLEEPGRRTALFNALNALKENKVTDEQLRNLGLTDESEIQSAYEESLKKHHEFIYEGDYIDFIKEVIESGKYKNKNFRIRGTAKYSYSDKTERAYESYVPSRIYLAGDDEEPYSVATMNFLFGEDSFDDMSLEEKGKYYINGWMMEYDDNRKKPIPIPTTIAIPGNITNSNDVVISPHIAKKFKTDSENIMEYGMEVNMLNGAPRVELTLDMLTDTEREDLELEIITWDDLRKAYGANTFGEVVREYQYSKPIKGFTSGAQPTSYTAEDMVIPPIEADDDIFDDDDEI